jgi:two-component system osmolarity sensor histidine kinase EnvZ
LTRKPHSLLFRTAVTITLALLTFMIITLGAAVYFVAMPIGKRSADDLAALMILAANTWHESAPETHANLRQRLLADHGLSVAAQAPSLPELNIDYPYFLFLRDALTRRTGTEITLLRNPGGSRVWVDLEIQGETVRLGVERTRVSASPPIVLLLVITGGALLALFASLAVVRRVAGPLERLSQAAREVGRGESPQPLAEDGPEELAALARAFNRMSLEVQELLENRTVMVAGISHDLRTPLTRLGLAVEMLNDNEDPDLVAGVRRDLAAMEQLIKQFMELAQGLSNACKDELDLRDPVALERILANLLANAAHYGGGKDIEVELQCDEQHPCMLISDRGPGIPDEHRQAVFRPFHRLDSARENRTGGSGLGLAIARQLADKNGWRIELRPRDGGGTVAALEL